MEGSLCFAGRPCRFCGISLRPPEGRGLVRKGNQIRIAFRQEGTWLYWLVVSDAVIAAVASWTSLSPPVSPCWVNLQPFNRAIYISSDATPTPSSGGRTA